MFVCLRVDRPEVVQDDFLTFASFVEVYLNVLPFHWHCKRYEINRRQFLNLTTLGFECEIKKKTAGNCGRLEEDS